MSIEEFHESNPADTSFANSIISKPEYKDISPVKYLAETYIREGKDGLLGINPGKIIDKNAANADVVSIMKNASAIYLGATIIAIEDIIKTGTFEPHAMNNNLLKGFNETKWSPLLINKIEDEVIDSHAISKLISIASNDKTFTTFFDDGFNALPSSLRNFLNESRMINPINVWVLPDYLERASLLVRQTRNLRNYK